MTSASVATAGIIGWVGLVVPHLARSLVGPDFARLIPTAALLGGGYLLLIDTLARTMAPVEIPLGILTAVIGTPFFIWLLASVQRTWSCMSLAGRDLTIGYSDRVVGRGLDVALEQGEVLALLGPERRRQDHAAQDAARPARAAGRRGAARRPLARRDLRSASARGSSPMCRRCTCATFAFTVETVVLMGRTAHGNLFSRPIGARPRGGGARARALRHRASRASGPTP